MARRPARSARSGEPALKRRSGSWPASSTGTRSRRCGCSGRLADGRLIAIAALRPVGADGHGDELRRGLIGPPGELEALAESLLSTEHGADELPRRIGLELYRDPDGLPLRIAGEATASTAGEQANVRRSQPCSRCGPRGGGPRSSTCSAGRRDRGGDLDFGGVLTTPLMRSFAAFQDRTGISGEALGAAMAAITEREGAHPLFELETGRMTEAEFLDRIRTELEGVIGRPPEMHAFKEIYFEALEPNLPMIELMRDLRRAGTGWRC